MKRFLIVGATVLMLAGALNAVPVLAEERHPTVAEQSLRALAARHDLAIGTAVDMDVLRDAADPQYRALAASQFSTVTAENVMKWESLEPPGASTTGARPTS